MAEGLKQALVQAERRGGLCTRADLAAAGVTRSEVRWACRAAGPLVPVHRDVFCLQAARFDDRTRTAAALLQVGPLSAACRRASGRLGGLDGCEASEVDVWVARNRRAQGIRIARTIVHPSALVVRKGLLATDVPTTLLQLGAVATADDVEAALESALRLGAVTIEQLRARLGWCGATGMGVLREVLDRRPPGAAPTESLAETRFVQLVRTSAILPTPRRQVLVPRIGGGHHRADFCFDDVLMSEVVGRAVHGRSIIADRRRLNAISGMVALPVCWHTWDDIVDHPAETLRELEAAYVAAKRAAL